MKSCIIILFLIINNCWSQSQLGLLNLKNGDNYLAYEIESAFDSNCNLVKIIKNEQGYRITSLNFKIDSIKSLRKLDFNGLRELFNEVDTMSDSIREKVSQFKSNTKSNRNTSFFYNVVFSQKKSIKNYKSNKSICEVIKDFDTLNVFFVEMKSIKADIDVNSEKYIIKRNFGALGRVGYDYKGSLYLNCFLINYNGLEINEDELKELID